VLNDITFHVLYGIPVLVTLWRAPQLLRNWWNAELDEKYNEVFKVFKEWIQDIPYILIGLLSFHRIFLILRKAFRSNSTAAEIRQEAVTQFLNALIDIPMTIAAIIVFGTGYRSFNLYNRLRNKVTAMLCHIKTCL
jgi:hypothetical protein